MPDAATESAAAWPGLRMRAAGDVTTAGGLIGARPVTDTISSVTGFADVLRNMKPTSLKTVVAGGTSGFV